MQRPHVGAFVDIKYLGKFYEAEILKISGVHFLFNVWVTTNLHVNTNVSLVPKQ